MNYEFNPGYSLDADDTLIDGYDWKITAYHRDWTECIIDKLNDKQAFINEQARRITELEAERDEYKANLLEYVNECGGDLLTQKPGWLKCAICGDTRPDTRDVDDYIVCTNCCPEGCTPAPKSDIGEQ